MIKYSPSITNLINAFKRLPTVGGRTAERFVFYLLKSGKKEVGGLITSLEELLKKVKSCAVCWNFTDQNPCVICGGGKRDQTTVCVVAEPADLAVIERTNEYSGLYHVLRGLIDPANETSLRQIKIKELLLRLKKERSLIREVILALNPDVAGETTMLYLEKIIKSTNPRIKTSRLARGLPLGGDLKYADDITLGSAIKNRTQKK